MTTTTNNYPTLISTDLPGAYPIQADQESTRTDNTSESSSYKQGDIDGGLSHKHGENATESSSHDHLANDQHKPYVQNVATVAPHGSSALGGVGVNPRGAPLIDETPSPAHPFYPSPVDGTHKIPDVNHDEIHPFFSPKSNEEHQLGTSNDNTRIPGGHQIHKMDDLINPPNGEHRIGAYKESTTIDGDSPTGTTNNKPTHIDIPPEVDNTNPHNYILSRGAPMAADTNGCDRPLEQNNDQVDPASHEKVTKKEKVGTALQKTIGTVKEKIGKMVKNENLAEKGAQQKEHAEIKQKLRAIDQ